MNDLIGKTILHYKILKKLGQGGMGVVYLGEDTKLKREVAIKFLPYNVSADKDERKRFEAEAQTAASLNHPNVSTIYSIEEPRDDVFIVMEYVKGDELRYLIKNRKIPISKVIGLSIQIAEALEYAHQKGIIHRDIKPANIMVTEDGKAKIMDFGLAKFTGGVQQTKYGFALGTAAYMSPEQVLGGEVDERTDIFSFGIVFYEMLSGKYPFRGEYEQAILYSIVNEEPYPLNEKNNPAIDESLCELVFRCLKKDKNERISSFREVLNKLWEFTGENSQKGLKIISTDRKMDAQKAASLIKSFIPQKSNVFIGREKQILQMQKKIGMVLNGHGSITFVCGEPGIGKTQMITHVIKSFNQSSFHVLYGRCVSHEGGPPYHSFVNAIKNSFTEQGKNIIDLISMIAEAHGISIANRIPLIRSFMNISGDYSDALLHKEQLWDAVLFLFKIFSADKPLILVLDDIQWADKASLGLFSFIARNISELPLMLIAAHRPLGPINNENAALLETIRNLRIENLAEKIDLERLSEEETRRAIREALDKGEISEEIFKTIYRKSEGNPLFVNELVNLMKDRGLVKLVAGIWHLNIEYKSEIVSERVQDVIKQRIDQLDRQSRDILELASCEGEYFKSDILGGYLNIERIKLLKILQILENDFHLIRHEKDFYRFDHILIRDVLYDSILPELRDEYHRDISFWLIDKYSGKDEYASRIAYHLISSGEEQKAIDYLLTAAIRAKDLYAVEEALNYYEQVLKIYQKVPDHTDNEKMIKIKEGLGDVCTSLGNAQNAVEHFSGYLSLARKMNKQTEITRALRKLSESYRTLGNIDQAKELCNEALGFAYKSNDNKEIIETLNTLAYIYASQGDYNKAIEFSEKAYACSGEANELKNKSVSLSNMGFAYWHQGNYLKAMEKFDNAISLQRSIGDNRGLSTSLNFLGLLYWKLGKYYQALNAAEESVKIKKSIADYRAIPGSINVIGDVYREIGDLKNAIKYHNESLKLAKEHQNRGAICDNIRDLGEDYFNSGELEKAINYYMEVIELASASNIKWYETRTYLSLSGVYLVQNDLNRAKEYLKLGIEQAEKINARELIIESLWNQALIQAKENQISESCKSMEKAIKIAVSISYQAFLWKLYLDYGKILSLMNESFKAQEAINNSKKIVQLILSDLNDEKMRDTFLNSNKVKELFSDNFIR